MTTPFEEFEHLVEQARARVEQARAQPDSRAVEQLLPELQHALELLYMAHEELRVQHQLLIARDDGEDQRGRYQELFASAPAALVVTDRDGTVQELNHAAGRLLGGIDPTEVPATSIFAHLVAEDHDAARRALLMLGATQDGDAPDGQALSTRLRGTGTAGLDIRIAAVTASGSITWLLTPPDSAKRLASDREVAMVGLVAQATADLVGDFDVIEMLTTLCERLSEVIGIDACGVLLSDGEVIEVAAVSGAAAQAIEFAQMQVGEGPCVEAMRQGQPLIAEGAEIARRWPAFAAVCEQVGMHSVAAFPLPGPDGPMGTLNTFRLGDAGFAPEDLATCEAVARVIVLAILNARGVDDSRQMVDHLRHALESRVVIEQAKGVVAHNRRIDVGAAFDLLRGTARGRRVKLHALAADVVAGWVDPADLD